MSWTEEQLAEHYRKLRTPPEQLESPSKCEADIQQECVKLMQEDGWRVLRTDPVSDKSRGKGFGEVGMADYLFVRPIKAPRSLDEVELVWIEWKARNGKVSSHQAEWHSNERARGFLTWIASVDFPASVEGFREFYAKTGLMRRSKWW